MTLLASTTRGMFDTTPGRMESSSIYSVVVAPRGGTLSWFWVYGSTIRCIELLLRSLRSCCRRKTALSSVSSITDGVRLQVGGLALALGGVADVNCRHELFPDCSAGVVSVDAAPGAHASLKVWSAHLTHSRNACRTWKWGVHVDAESMPRFGRGTITYPRFGRGTITYLRLARMNFTEGRRQKRRPMHKWGQVRSAQY